MHLENVVSLNLNLGKLELLVKNSLEFPLISVTVFSFIYFLIYINKIINVFGNIFK